MKQNQRKAYKKKKYQKIELRQFYCEKNKLHKKICAKQCELCTLLTSDV